jgi:hypothetical protein
MVFLSNARKEMATMQSVQQFTMQKVVGINNKLISLKNQKIQTLTEKS